MFIVYIYNVTEESWAAEQRFAVFHLAHFPFVMAVLHEHI